MRTPDDLLALAGRSLHGRIHRALGALPPDVLQRMDARLRRDAREAGLVYERDGGEEAIRVLPRPLCVLPEQMTYLHHVTLQIVHALKQLPTWYLGDPQVRDIVRVAPEEDAFFREVWSPSHATENPVYARLDAVFDPTSAHWRETLRFVESNLSGVGGIHIAPVSERLVMRDVVPHLAAFDPLLRITAPRDQRELFLQLLVDHQRALGLGGGALCLLEPCYVTGGPVEQSALCQHLNQLFGVEMVHADPRDLRIVDGEVWAFDHRVDVAYRDYDLVDLLALEAEGHDLEPMRMLFRENRVVSSIGAELDQKASFEVLTDPELADRLLTPEQRRLFARHVLWTRRVAERRVSLPDGRSTDLLPWMRLEREHLVLKPNRGYGGSGILLGSVASASEWDAAVDEAVASADDPARSWVVQRLTEIPVFEFPVVGDDGHVHDEPFYVVMGFAPTEGGLGNLCRVSQKQVVNVAQRGGVAAVLVGEADHSLRGPPRQRRGPEALAALRGEIAALRHLDAAIDLLGWDEETMLPPGAREERGEQLATIEALRHRNLVSPWLGDWLGEASAGVEPGSADAVELQILARRRDHALLVPEGLVRAWAEARSRSLAAWEEARVDGRYGTWAPAFGVLLDRCRERAQALAQRSIDPSGGAAYDALLDEHDPGMTRAAVGPVLRRLRDDLLPLIDLLPTDGPPAAWRVGHPWADPAQDAFCRALCGALGFDFDRGRLDRSTHPFTLMAGERDVRMTVKVDERDPFVAVFGALHEVGHGLYDQGLAVAHHQRLMGTAPGMAVHESQARLIENLVGRSRAFWQWQLPKLRDRFPDALRGVSLDAFVAEINRVHRGQRRVTADEVTYNLHVVVRYELEELLIGGHLVPADLPAAWNQAMIPLAGKPPASDVEGCMQDVHWAVGSFGYFPSYTIGNLYAAQLFEAWRRERSDGLDAIAAGQPEVLTSWLADRVWRHGHRYSEDELIRRATGSGLDSGPFVRYIRDKYVR